MIDQKRFKEALERGLEAGYRVTSHSDQTVRPYAQLSGYLGGNVEEKMREAITTAFEVYFDEPTPGRWRKHLWKAQYVPMHPHADDEGEILQCHRCCTIKGDPGSETCPL